MNRLLARCCATLIFLAIAGRATDAVAIPAGFDLLTTTAGTEFNPDGPGPIPAIPFVGVPLGTFDFGGGPVAVGTTDTIVERLAPASGPGIDTIPIEMVSLQLMSAAPVDLGGGLDSHYVTLQSNRSLGEGGPGPLSTGTMAIDFDTQTFSSEIGIFFDVRIGALGGPILASGADTLFNEDPIVWTETLPGAYSFAPDATEKSNLVLPVSFHKFTITVVAGDVPLQIPGINDGFLPLVIPLPVVPEPSTFVLGILGLLSLGFVGWRRRRR